MEKSVPQSAGAVRWLPEWSSQQESAPFSQPVTTVLEFLPSSRKYSSMLLWVEKQRCDWGQVDKRRTGIKVRRRDRRKSGGVNRGISLRDWREYATYTKVSEMQNYKDKKEPPRVIQSPCKREDWYFLLFVSKWKRKKCFIRFLMRNFEN